MFRHQSPVARAVAPPGEERRNPQNFAKLEFCSGLQNLCSFRSFCVVALFLSRGLGGEPAARTQPPQTLGAGCPSASSAADSAGEATPDMLELDEMLGFSNPGSPTDPSAGVAAGSGGAN
eukprot:5077761-Alexandrium_andersonii.AAC.1